MQTPKRPCLYFQKGKCNKGTACEFLHTAAAAAAAAAPTPCRYAARCTNAACTFAHPERSQAAAAAATYAHPARAQAQLQPGTPSARSMPGVSRATSRRGSDAEERKSDAATPRTKPIAATERTKSAAAAAAAKPADDHCVIIKNVRDGALSDAIGDAIRNVLRPEQAHATLVNWNCKNGKAYANFISAAAATRAAAILNGKPLAGVTQDGRGAEAYVKGSREPIAATAAGVMYTANQTVIISGIPAGTTREAILDLLKSASVANSEAVHLIAPKAAAAGAVSAAAAAGAPALRAFVNFSRSQDAKEAAEALNNSQLPGSDSKLSAWVQSDPSGVLGLAAEDVNDDDRSAVISGSETPSNVDGRGPEDLLVCLKGFPGDPAEETTMELVRRAIAAVSITAEAVKQPDGKVAMYQTGTRAGAAALLIEFTCSEDVSLAVQALTGVRLPGGEVLTASRLIPQAPSLLDKFPADQVVVVVGPAVVGDVGEAGFRLELMQLQITPAATERAQRMVRVAFDTAEKAAQAAQTLNGREILGAQATAYLASSRRAICGGVRIGMWHGEAPGSVIARNEQSRRELDELRRLETEARFAHSNVAQAVNSELESDGLISSHQPGFHRSDITPGIWMYGVMPIRSVAVAFDAAAAERLAAQLPDVMPDSLDDPVRLDAACARWHHHKLEAGTQGVWLRGAGAFAAKAVYEQSQDLWNRGGLTVLRWVAGESLPGADAMFVGLPSQDNACVVYGASERDVAQRLTAIEQGTRGAAVASDESDSLRGSFCQAELLRWQGDTSAGEELIKKSTWTWWVRGEASSVESVHECFTFDSRSTERATGAVTVCLQDHACGTILRLGPSQLHIQRHGNGEFVLLCSGGWLDADCTQWESAEGAVGADGVPLDPMLSYFETRPEWAGGRWWVNTRRQREAEGIVDLLQEQSRNDIAVLACDGRGREVMIGGPGKPGDWVGDRPRSRWLFTTESEMLREACAPLELQLLQLGKQERIFTDEFQRLHARLIGERDLRAATMLLAQMRRELSRFQARLPAYAFRNEMLEVVRRNTISILIGATGSGKSTQTLPFLVDAGAIPGTGVVACTQPRKVAATSLADYVSSEWGCPVGGAVGVRVGGTRKVGNGTQMIYQTEQVLLNELLRDPLLSKYGAVVMDEAHERTIDQDLLLGFLKEVCRRRPKDFRLVIASATIDPMLFMEFLGIGEDAVIRIPGRTFPIEHEWLLDGRPKDQAKNVARHVANKALEVLDMPQHAGDILCFLPTPEDVNAAVTLAKQSLQRSGRADAIVLPLYGQLTPEEQQQVFKPTPSDMYKIVFATNVAETSITVDGVTVVIDCGLAKVARYDPIQNMNRLEVASITQSSAKQRAGRAGRTRPGRCYHLYSEEEFQAMRDGMEPEIKRTELLGTVLRLKELGIRDVAAFDFIEHPGRDRVADAERLLTSFGLLQAGELTDHGRRCRALDLAPRHYRLLQMASELGVLNGALLALGVLAAPGRLFTRPKAGDKAGATNARQAAREVSHPSGDFCTGLKVIHQPTIPTAQRVVCQALCVVQGPEHRHHLPGAGHQGHAAPGDLCSVCRHARQVARGASAGGLGRPAPGREPQPLVLCRIY